MASIILPRRIRRQPQRTPRIDRSGIGGKAKVILLGNSPEELVNGASRVGTAAVYAATREGIGLQSPNAFTTWSASVPEIDPVTSGSFTCNWYGI